MVAIFTTAEELNNICRVPNKTPWQDMILKLGEVFVDSKVDIPLDFEDPLFILDAAIKIDTSKMDYINSIAEAPAKVLEEPCGIFILNIDENKASDIQTKYGVICLSKDKMEHTFLTQKGTSAVLIENESGKTWHDIFRKFKSTPTNSTLIIDAHLFENDAFDETAGSYDSRRNYGISNLFDVLNEILPTYFSDVYHVGVLLTNTDEAKTLHRSRTNLTNKQIATAINKLKNRLQRPYEINIEVIFFSPSDNDTHKLIHNRRILTNTYILDAPYKLAAFNSDGTSRASQKLTLEPLFELIHIDSESDMNEKRLRYDLDDLYKYIDLQCENNPTGVIYNNGILKDSFFNVKHRFLT